jgi:hypothetical protein
MMAGVETEFNGTNKSEGIKISEKPKNTMSSAAATNLEMELDRSSEDEAELLQKLEKLKEKKARKEAERKRREEEEAACKTAEEAEQL